MRKLIDDLRNLTTGIHHIHNDVEHISDDLDMLARTAGLTRNELLDLTDMKDRLKNIDALAHNVLKHINRVKGLSLQSLQW